MDPIISVLIFLTVFGILIFQYGKFAAFSIYVVCCIIAYLGTVEIRDEGKRVFASVMWPVTLHLYLNDEF